MHTMFKSPVYVPWPLFGEQDSRKWRKLGSSEEVAGAEQVRKERGSRIYAVVTDVSQESQVQACFDELKKNFATPTVLVNCAGIVYEALAVKNEMQKMEQVLSTNYFGAANMCKEFLRSIPVSSSKIRTGETGGLEDGRFLRIVNISSFIVTQGTRGLSAYAASKGAINGYTRTIAMEYPTVRGIPLTANVVSPGVIRTDMTAHLNQAQIDALLQSCAVKRMGEPEEVANVIAFLCTPQASYITGQNINVTGGMV
uniref:3-ketoacyl-[acyl-carrier-protein] reductase beta subunit n=1 Tax=Lygus hesperus TaxID=30085 RepID=A0A0A9XTD0_LYGHE